ncbi:hypothetical protein KIN20_023233 [Parelaphostrongylus tenuis]|uniref:Uncharacterized protein n=1 Tax=Parelaphostrongylus tenuis TaxID=148309 RepID=A0AAD5MVD3_PARTN|nr:hypothetical protein KIN20_023233 [Parelaphostrongylus tenuis]
MGLAYDTMIEADHHHGRQLCGNEANTMMCLALRVETIRPSIQSATDCMTASAKPMTAKFAQTAETTTA